MSELVARRVYPLDTTLNRISPALKEKEGLDNPAILILLFAVI